MDTIIVFGASTGGRNFIENSKNQYLISAIVDNDVTKRGQTVQDIPIIAPEQIHLFSYDYIVVASMYVHSITEQLKNLGVRENQIKYASKNSMKVIAHPFKEPSILKCANQMIMVLSDILKDIRHYYTFGTLLGIVRDGQLIPWDDDIDIAIFAEDAEQVKELLLHHIDDINRIMDTKMYMRYYSNGEIASVSIDCYYEQEKVFNINLDCIYVEGDIARQELNKTPLKYFEKMEHYHFGPALINVPHQYEQYLTYTYGDWKTVKENTSFNDNTLSFIEPVRSITSEVFYEKL